MVNPAQKMTLSRDTYIYKEQDHILLQIKSEKITFGDTAKSVCKLSQIKSLELHCYLQTHIIFFFLLITQCLVILFSWYTEYEPYKYC